MVRSGRCRMPGVCVLVALLSPMVSLAQELPGAAEPAEAEGLPEAPERIRPWAEGHYWRSTSLTTPVSRLARASDGALLVMGEDGGIYRQEGADRWRQVLGGRLVGAGEIDEEGILLDAESAVQDFTDTSVDESTDTDDSGTEISSSVDVGGNVEDAVESGIQDAGLRVESLPDAQALWASVAAPEVILASRPEGSWRSTDNGNTWNPLTALPPSRAFLEIDGRNRRSLVLSATDNGIWFSVDDGRSWLEGSSAMRGVSVLTLATDGALVYAGTVEGLWVSMDGVRWAKLLPPRYADVQIDAITTDPSWVGGLWAATPEGLLRSDDTGQTFRPASRNPLIGTDRLIELSGAGQLIAAGSDGVWETVDGGVRWNALSKGLPGPNIADVIGGVQPAIATRTGVYLLSRPVSDEDSAAIARTAAAAGLSAEDVVYITLRRGGLDLSPLSVQRKFARATFTPLLRLKAERESDIYVFASYKDSGSTDRLVTPSWRFSVELCFGGCATSSTDISYDSSTDYDVTGEGVDLVVIGDQIYSSTDETSSIAPAAVNVAQRISRYRNDLTDYVIELYYSRERLLHEQPAIASLPLMDQVLHDLQIQAVTSRLDIYTDGRFTASLDSEQ